MPRLSDLLSDKIKKELIDDAQKARAQAKRNDRDPRPASTAKPAAPVPQLIVPDFVAVDVETTGLNFSSDHIIEVGAVKFSGGKATEEFSSFVKPPIPIPSEITDLTGITDADVAGAPTFAEIAPKLTAFFGALPLCGHQVDFDKTFINKAFEKAGMATVGKQTLDTALLSRILLEADGRFNLKSVSNSLSVTLNNAHRALNDARACGEVAVLLIPKLANLPQNVRQTMAAAAPASYIKSLIFKTLGNLPPLVKVRSNAETTSFPKLSDPEKLQEIEINQVEGFFSTEGALATAMPNYLPRKAQHDMAVEVTSALNTQSFLIAEAGTGTGKSLAYMVPAAIFGIKNGCRVLIATRTKNLQDQLISKELPLIGAALGSDFKYSVLKGRSNYVCLDRFQRLLRGESGNLSIRERFALLPLIPWINSTNTGDIEEQNLFNAKWFKKIWDFIAAESYGCNGRRCPMFKNCFLQQARQKALSSHIVVINHALFFSDICSGSSFLGKIGSIIFDEAHHLEASGHKHLRVELDTSRVALFIEELNNLSQLTGNFNEISKIHVCGKEIKSHLKQVRKRSQNFLEAVSGWAKTKKNSGDAAPDYQIPLKENDLSSNVEILAFGNTLDSLKELLYNLKQEISNSTLPEKEIDLIREASLVCLERCSQMHADLLYLSAAKTDDHAFWVEGNLEKGWTKLCGVPLDVAGLLSTIWAECQGSIIFTSATLSVARSTDYFARSVGLTDHKARTAIAQFPSPFRSHQTLFGAISDAPDPDDHSYALYIANIIIDLHRSFKKNILVLFTANSLLASVYQKLKSDSGIDRQHLLAQGFGAGGRHVLLEQFKQNSGMMLLGTDSFWEGIDAPGDSCEIVIIPRLPFPVPTHPLNMAIQEKMEKTNGESFMSYSVPEAVIRFRQGCGRLIRTSSDRGALLVLDNRIIKKGYGKQFSRSIETEFKNFSDKHDMLSQISRFFTENPEDRIESKQSYVPFDEV
jgi:ATP-dependent DNA helicase DinG